ncbi:MAG: hypothetical protein JWR32_1353 [Mycobacterium sp.]|jgi:hypothetical protein|nr:hypothetical protein [Mycobacterium sp.]
MSPEWQRRPFDPTRQKSVPEIMVEAAQPINIDRALINPRALDERALGKRPQPKKGRLINVGKPIVHRRMVIESGSVSHIVLEWWIW